jgi:hypothetical protein
MGNDLDLDRREGGLIRIPFVRRCFLRDADGGEREAFMVNINVQGAYIADDALLEPGTRLVCRFRLPASELELELDASVAWVNSRQQHPVHSLPRGFGLRFEAPPAAAVARIEGLIHDYLARQRRARKRR